MKLSYQLLKKLILEQLEANEEISKLRNLANNKSEENRATAYKIYKAALNEPDKDISIPIIDYYKDHFKKEGELSPQEDQAIKKPEVLIMSNRVRRVGNVDDTEAYEEIELFTFYRNPKKGFEEGVPLGKIKVYIYKDFEFEGEFLGDKNFNGDKKLKLSNDVVKHLNRMRHGDFTHEYYDYLNLVLDDYIKGEGKEKYENYIKGENK